MAKRKRTNAPASAPAAAAEEPVVTKKAKSSKPPKPSKSSAPVTLQIVTGSYDRVLHGVTATISADDQVEFADTFLFNAHTSAIRCLALSPPSAPEAGKAQKIMLATGGTDERINVYNISAHPPVRKDKDVLSAVAPRKILENSKNRELGTLLHHSSTITKLAFPTKSKLISASEDSTIAITRIRDMSMLSSIKVPIPKPQGRPSGDTAALGGAPSGVNDFAVHSSMKVMISLSKGERCMRLWNLLTGKKAGVLNFGRDLLQEIGEPRHSTGEGRKIIWHSNSEEFCVGFDRNLLIFGVDGQPRCKVMAESRTKIHDFCYLSTDDADKSILAVSTEDGRIVFLSTDEEDLVQPEEATDSKKATQLPTAKMLGQLGGKEGGVSGRIKAFSLLRPDQRKDEVFFACGSSDGKLRLFQVTLKELVKSQKSDKPAQVGKLIGTYNTDNRITCMEAFVMIPRPEDHDGPPILRPIPRRPFNNVNFTVPQNEELSPPPSPHPRNTPAMLNLDFLNSKLLNARLHNVVRGDDSYATGSGSGTISRAQSVKNLTSSTLFGIYSPSTTGIATQDEPSTPWGLESPTAPPLSAEDLAYALQKNPAHIHMERRRSSQHPPPPLREPLSRPVMAFHLALRATLLFGLGILYGALVARFQDRRKYATFQMEDAMATTYDVRYMAFWGVSGVVLGGLLPLFDGLWEDMCGQDSAVEDDDLLDQTRDGEIVLKGTTSSTDWALVARGIGAFIGIVYAIRKSTWTSTLQVSLTLALVNPFLWYLIDGTPAGFLFSAAIGLTGSLVLTGLKADMVPAPASASSIWNSFGAAEYGLLNVSSSAHASQPSQQSSGSTLVLGGLATKESVEMTIWMLSVLFCCGVCFGNIGRRLTLWKSRGGKGRWAEGTLR
ncbi:MAK11-like protein [Apiospora marii]|uniref:MAK11-like protein n=1 Tax=Apiospora marii TaxID=335849 RepID=UPI00313003AA